MNTPYDENPESVRLINFASNINPDKSHQEQLIEAYKYGFKIGWQTHWEEVEKINKP